MSKGRCVLVAHHATAMSGAEQGLLDVARALRAADYDVQVGLPAVGPLVDAITGEGFAVHPLPLARLYKTRNPLSWLVTACRFIRATVTVRALIRRLRIEALHCNGDASMVLCAVAARLSGIPCIWHRRDLVSLGRTGAVLARMATRIVGISESVTDATRAFAPQPGKAVTIYNGVALERLRPTRSPEEIREELEIPEGAVVTAAVGQLIPWKRQELFIDAAHQAIEKAPGLLFLVVGADLFGDHPEHVARLKESAGNGPAAERIRFTGYREDMAAIFAVTDILVHTAAREPFGRVVAEAMAAGIPVVAASACGPAELIEGGRSGLLVNPEDAGATATAVAGLALDADRRKSLGHAARERVLKEFAIDSFNRQLSALYSDILSAEKPS